ncbi:MAG TPA: sulfite oxidase [Egibacteraceae bacterium]|nr:sulfite oxidase [Actinomycetota bacterium]HWB72978.1 sulfite oxidase [Egibacteraceae bacterium]
MVSSDEPPAGTTASPDLTLEELRLATRNHGMPLEALRYDVTPVGLHYLLVHYDIPAVDPRSWRLEVGGLVQRPRAWTVDELRTRPAVTHRVTMECAGNGRARLRPRALSQPWLHEAVGTGEWTGTPLAGLLAESGLAAAASEVVFTGLDRGVEGGITQHYQRSLPLDEARRDDVLLAYGLNGQPLPPQHGAPLRLLVPGWYGMASVKWLQRVTVTDEPFEGYQQARAYRLRDRPDERGRPLSRMAVRSLLLPPGIPDFFTRRRVLDQGRCVLEGRAWSGHGAIVAVEVSTDGGLSWRDAQLQPPPDPRAWTRWHATWTPPGPGSYELCSRATDAAGNSQPDEPVWNLGGYAVNAVHRVPVEVRSPSGA